MEEVKFNINEIDKTFAKYKKNDIFDGVVERVYVDTYQRVASGENIVRIVNPVSTTVSFTAETAGTYLISPANGELNADLVISDEFTSESIVMPYTFTLDAGETITFIVFTTDIMNLAEDYIDLIITKK